MHAIHRSDRRRAAAALLAVLLIGACGSSVPSASPTPRAPAASPAGSPPPAPTAAPSGAASQPPTSVEPSVPGESYADMAVTLELTADCGLCGPERWLTELPVFRLYADGLAVYRPLSEEPESTPYRFLQLDDPDFEALIRYALDEGGLRGAAATYPGNADDAPSVHVLFDARWIDEEAIADVVITPLIGDGTTDTEGNPLQDLPRRERLEAFAELLSNFDTWLESQGAAGEAFIPDGYTAALVEPFDGQGDAAWPWPNLTPEQFGTAEFGRSLAHVTPAQAASAGVGPGGGLLGTRPIGPGRAATVLVRPLLPGDARPGAFGLRADVPAVTVEAGLRVRSLPEVSDASIKYEPLLARGAALYVIDGPVAGSGYAWYQVHAPESGLTGWVAAAAKTGEDWIAPRPITCTLAASPDAFVNRLGYDLMHLLCYSGVEMSGRYLLAPPADDGLRCPDVYDGTHEPAWLDEPVACVWEFLPEFADTGSSDLPQGGVLHPSIGHVPDAVLEAFPEGTLVDVVGRLDHPDARSCIAHADVAPDPALVRLYCRATFVITEMVPASG